MNDTTNIVVKLPQLASLIRQVAILANEVQELRKISSLQTKEAKDFMTIKEASAFFQTSSQTIHKRIREHSIQRKRSGKHNLVNRRDIEKALSVSGPKPVFLVPKSPPDCP